MKAVRLVASPELATPPSARERRLPRDAVPHVAPVEAPDADRRRSLGEELQTARQRNGERDPGRPDIRQLIARLRDLGEAAVRRLCRNTGADPPESPRIDERV